MAQLIEQDTNYAYIIKHIENITFKKLRSVAVEFTRGLPKSLSDELYRDIQRGVCQLQNEPELNMYIHALGLMHEAKLQHAFDHMSSEFTDHSTIDIIDYGCGQAIGTICYADFLSKIGKNQKVRKVTLIEPSQRALARAALHVSCFFPDAEIVTIDKGFDDLVEDDLFIDREIPTLHIFSNVLDLADDCFNLKSFAYLIEDKLDGYREENQFICIEPYFDYDIKDEQPHLFMKMLNIEPYYFNVYTRGTFVEDRDWTCQIVIGHLDSIGWLWPFFPDANDSREDIKLLDLAAIAEKEERYNDAFDCYVKASDMCWWEKDKAYCKRKIGEYYLGGHGVNKNYEKAVEWFSGAAQSEDMYARNSLGMCYYNGVGVTQDFMEAVKWYRKAARQGSAESQYYLGLCYEEGNGVKENLNEAVKWYRKSAEQEYDEAQCNLGNCYARGNGVAKDNLEAVKWYLKSADQGNTRAQFNLGICYYKGEGVVKDYAEGVKWYFKSAEQGNAKAQFNLGNRYYNGEGVVKDYAEAVKWYLKSAEQGNAKAQFALGYCYYKGEGVVKDYAEAVKWYLKSAEQGNAKAQGNLGNRYYNGEGVVKDYAEAVKWYFKSAEQGDAKVQFALGTCYENGCGVAKDYSEAVKWYHKSAEQGNLAAQLKLDDLRLKGY